MLTLFYAELKRRWRMVKNYPLEEISGTFILTMLFYGVFLSARYLAGPQAQFGDRLNAIVIGYATWLLVLQTFGSIAGELQDEAKSGTLQQLMMSSFGTSKVFFIRAVADLSVSLVVMTTCLTMILFLTGTRINVPLLAILPVVTLLAGSIGLGFLVGAATLLFKRTGKLISLCNFGLMFLVMTPLETFGGTASILGNFLPLVPSVGMLRDLMARQGAFDLSVFALVLLNALVYFVVGFLVFRDAELRAKTCGSIASF